MVTDAKVPKMPGATVEFQEHLDVAKYTLTILKASQYISYHKLRFYDYDVQILP